MLVLGAEQIQSLAFMPDLIACLEQSFRVDHVVPPRHVMSVPGGLGDRRLLLMPAFDGSGAGAVKLTTVIPDNRAKGLPTFQGVIVLYSESGTPTALLDGAAVTRLRTAAASAVASRYLSRIDSSRLLVIGTGALAPHMAVAHCVVRSITHIKVWGRKVENAHRTADAIRALVGSAIKVGVADALEEVAATSDIISCVTSSVMPVLAGRWLRAGAFVDLVGSYSPDAREADDDVILRSRIFVDTHEGALSEAGDLLDPIRRGVIRRDSILGNLAQLVRGQVKGRTSDQEITLFKSVGTAVEDLAAARMIVSSC